MKTALMDRKCNLPKSMQCSNWVTWCWFACKLDTI